MSTTNLPAKSNRRLINSIFSRLYESDFLRRGNNLILSFSIILLIAILNLVFGLSWTLEKRIKTQLLDRDRIMTTSTVHAEALEHLEDHQIGELISNTNLREEILHIFDSLPGKTDLVLFNDQAEMIWSSENIAYEIEASHEALQKTLNGESQIETPPQDLFLLHSHVETTFKTYVPLVRQNQVIGILGLWQKKPQLALQLEQIIQETRLRLTIFGIILFVILLILVLWVTRILQNQNQQLKKSSDSLIEINKKLEATQEQLVNKERLSAIGEVCSVVAHGLKNPISSVRAAVQLLEIGDLDKKEEHEISRDIIIEVDKLTKRLNDLLNFIKPFSLDRQYTHLEELLVNSVRTLQRQAEKSNVSINVFPSENIETIAVDSTLIEEAILIVLGNAIEASSEGQTISCRVIQQDNKQVVEVKDQGAGIPSHTMKRVFEQFYTTRSKGIGIGLTVCRKLIELHQGKVELNCPPEGGTIAHLILPIES